MSSPLREKIFPPRSSAPQKSPIPVLGKGPKKKVHLSSGLGVPEKNGGVPPEKVRIFLGGPPNFPGAPQVPGASGGPRERDLRRPSARVGDSPPPTETGRRRQFQVKNVKCLFRWGDYDFFKGPSSVYYTSSIEITFLERFSQKFSKFITRRQES